MARLLENIKKYEEIDKHSVDIIDVDRDGNCYYRTLSTLSLYFANDESFYKFFLEQIHLAEKNNINELKEFFVSEGTNKILVNTKIGGYINKIIEDKFFAGNKEIYNN